MSWKVEVGKGLFVEFDEQHLHVVFAHISDGEDTVESVSLTSNQALTLYHQLGTLLMGVRAYPTPSYEDLLPPTREQREATFDPPIGCGNAPTEQCCGGVCNG